MAEPLLVRGLSGSPSAILVEDGSISALGVDAESAPLPDQVVDGTGLTAHPGFIDLQVNGIDELDFTADPEAMWRAGSRFARYGVTSFLPTIVSAPRGAVEAALRAWSDGTAVDGAVPIGVHIEGPFLSPARCGAHDAAYLREPAMEEIRSWLDVGARLLTIAPELPGALDAIRLIAGAGAVAAIGHTDADARTATAAVEAGARYATHLFNAMPPLLHRAPGAAGALLADERVTVGLIADGVHVDPLILGLVARSAAGRVSVVSDGVSRSLGGHRLDEGASEARLVDGTLAGGRHGLDHGVRTLATVAGRAAAISAVTDVPARLLGLDDGRGEIRLGGRADLVLLDEALQVAVTLVDGRVVHDGRPQ